MDKLVSGFGFGMIRVGKKLAMINSLTDVRKSDQSSPDASLRSNHGDEIVQIDLDEDDSEDKKQDSEPIVIG